MDQCIRLGVPYRALTGEASTVHTLAKVSVVNVLSGSPHLFDSRHAGADARRD